MSNYPPAAPTPIPPARKRRRWPWIVGGVIVVLVVISIATNGGKTGGGSTSPTGAPAGNEATTAVAVVATTAPAQPAQPATHTVVYQVTGHGSLTDVTYTTDGMTTTNQESHATLPWTKTITLPRDQAFEQATILAQGATESTSITVTITVDGKVAKTASATGYGVATANYLIPTS
jgi:hypothetical protein